MISLSLFILAGCDRARNSAPHHDSSKRSTSTEQSDIVDEVGKKDIFDERRAFWRKQKPSHYRLRFSLICDCSERTTQLVEVVKDGKVSMEKAGDRLTVEVRDGKLIEVLKENGERAKLEEFRSGDVPPDFIEYQWNIGKSEIDGVKLISDPEEYLWKRVADAIQSKAEKRIFISYDKKFGYIRKVDFRSSIPDYEFHGEITNFSSPD